MALDLTSLKAKIAARKALESSAASAPEVKEIKNETQVTTDTPDMPDRNDIMDNIIPAEPVQSVSTVPVSTPAIKIGAGTSRTSEIDHLNFLSKLDELSGAIHTQHPKMPVLLMLIHKQLTADPELVTVLSEEQIGVIVNGLKIQTKTELVGTIAKQSKARDKKTKFSADMF